MKAAEVYKIIRAIVGPWCKEQGFNRTTGSMLGWYRWERGRFLVFWFHCSHDGWDPCAGSKFVVEFQLGDAPTPGLLTYRPRIARFLNDQEREEVRRIQNSVIVKLDAPAEGHFCYEWEPRVLKWYLAKFDPVPNPYTDRDDIWFRYHDEEDIAAWANFVLTILPRAIAEAKSKGNAALDCKKGL